MVRFVYEDIAQTLHFQTADKDRRHGLVSIQSARFEDCFLFADKTYRNNFDPACMYSTIIVHLEARDIEGAKTMRAKIIEAAGIYRKGD